MLSTVFKVCAFAALVDAREKYVPRQTAFTQTEEFLAVEEVECSAAKQFEAACYAEGADAKAKEAAKKAVDDAKPKKMVATADQDNKDKVKAACCPAATKKDDGSCCR